MVGQKVGCVERSALDLEFLNEPFGTAGNSAGYDCDEKQPPALPLLVPVATVEKEKGNSAKKDGDEARVTGDGLKAVKPLATTGLHLDTPPWLSDVQAQLAHS